MSKNKNTDTLKNTDELKKDSNTITKVKKHTRKRTIIVGILCG